MNSTHSFKTADLYDQYWERPVELRVLDPVFHNFGGHATFSGPIATVQVHEDNVLVRQILSTPGEGRVLVVDGGMSLRCALLGDQLAQLGVDNGWTGIVIAGCIRDSEEIRTMPIGVKAIGTNPRKSVKRGNGISGEPVVIGNITISPDEWLYADPDGIIVSAAPLMSED